MMSSMILHTENKLLEPKDFFSEVRCKKDVDNFLERGLVLLDVAENDLDKLLLSIIKKLLDNKESVKVFDDHLDSILLSKAKILKNSIQYFDQNANQDDGLNERWIFSNVDFPFINKTYVAIVRLKNEMFFGPQMKYVKMFVLVLSPLNEKRVKNSIEVARTFATLFLDDTLRRKLLNTKSKSDALLQIKNESERRCKKNFSLNHMDHMDLKEADCVPKFRFSMLKGLRNDLKNIAKYYKSDFVDIFKDRKSQFKAISTTVFLYFTIILPTIAFGSVNDKSTNGMIDAQRALIGQFVGGIIFALIAGQPLTIVATTAPLCLYTKIIFDFSSSFEVDFYSMFAWVGIFNFAFLVIYSVLDLSQLMKYSTRGVEEIFSTFIFFAFTLDAFHDINRLFQDDYSSCKTTNNLVDYLKTNLTESNSTFSPDVTTYNPYVTIVTESPMNFTDSDQTSFKPLICDISKDRPILAIFLCLITFWLANKLSTLTKTSLLTKTKREFISDYSLPISILFFSLIANTVFQITPKDEFVFNNSHSTGFASLYLPSECILICLGLGFSLSLLFFMDQNISAALVQTPENNLKKPNSYDLDLVLIGVINLFLSLFGFPFMHGILPHSPLHAKNLAEIEYVVENGSVKENVLFVRETRVTAILSHILIGLSLFMIPYPINLIPISVLDGLFLFCAISTLIDNSFFDRFCLFITEQQSYPVNNVISKCQQRTVHKFTLIQIGELLLVCFFGFAPWPAVKMTFPIVIFLTIPFRKFVLTKIFDEKDINVLDSYKH